MTNIRWSRRAAAKKLGLAAIFLFSSKLLAKSLFTSSRQKKQLPTPTQAEGPFYPIRDQVDTDFDLTKVSGRSDEAEGTLIYVQGRVLDTQGQPLANAKLDVWQANHFGRYDHPGDRSPSSLDQAFQGRAHLTANNRGEYRFKTVMPGAYAIGFRGGKQWRARHIHFKISSAQFPQLTTQMYFRNDALIDNDLVIERLSNEQRELLICDAEIDLDSGLALYRFDIILDNDA